MKVSSISKDGYETLLLLAGPPSSDKISIAMASVQMDTKYWRRNTMIFKMFFLSVIVSHQLRIIISVSFWPVS